MNDSLSHYVHFHLFSASHLVALLALFLCGWLLIGLGSHASPRGRNILTHVVAYGCLSGIVFSLLVSLHDFPHLHWTDYLPLHFCDVMAASCAYALLRKSPRAKGISFFCVLCASFQALVTPNLQLDFPSLSYFSFFLSHGITVLAAFYLFGALNWRPGKFDFLSAQAFGICYLLAIHPVNLLLDTNFGFTRFIPENGSILSFLGPWPWYLVTMQIPAFVLMAVLNYIFYRIPRRSNDEMQS